jgi:hypothetical protein
MPGAKETQAVNAIGFVAVLLFAVGWTAAIVSWLYTAYHVVMGWFRSTSHEGTPSHRRRAVMGGLAFLGCGLFAMFNGLIGTWFGGWQTASGQ